MSDKKTKRVFYVSAHGGKWLYGKKGGLYSVRGHALNRAAYLLKAGLADTVNVYESQELTWTEITE